MFGPCGVNSCCPMIIEMEVNVDRRVQGVPEGDARLLPEWAIIGIGVVGGGAAVVGLIVVIIGPRTKSSIETASACTNVITTSSQRNPVHHHTALSSLHRHAWVTVRDNRTMG